MKIRKSVLAVVVIAGLLLCIGLAVYWQDFTVVRIGNEGKETENKKKYQRTVGRGRPHTAWKVSGNGGVHFGKDCRCEQCKYAGRRYL